LVSTALIAAGAALVIVGAIGLALRILKR